MTTIKKILSMCLISVMCVCTFATNAFAMEDNISREEMVPTESAAEISNESRASFKDGFVWTNSTTSASVYLSQTAKVNSTKKDYTGVLSQGSSGVYVFHFTNKSTGITYSLSFVCNGGHYTEKMGVELPTGNYTVVLRSSPSNCTLRQLTCNFIY